MTKASVCLDVGLVASTGHGQCKVLACLTHGSQRCPSSLSPHLFLCRATSADHMTQIFSATSVPSCGTLPAPSGK